jgi:hypothetical protein
VKGGLRNLSVVVLCLSRWLVFLALSHWFSFTQHRQDFKRSSFSKSSSARLKETIKVLKTKLSSLTEEHKLIIGIDSFRLDQNTQQHRLRRRNKTLILRSFKNSLLFCSFVDVNIHSFSISLKCFSGVQLCSSRRRHCQSLIIPFSLV